MNTTRDYEYSLQSLNITQLKEQLLSVEDQLENDDKQVFHNALTKATKYHNGQYRNTNDNKSPYITHPMRNTLRISSWGIKDVNILSASLLHDIIEDCADKITGYTTKSNQQGQRREALEILNKDFNEEITSIVSNLSNPIISMNLPREEKNIIYNNHLHSILDNKNSFIVKLSDYVDNAGSLYSNYTVKYSNKYAKLFNKYDNVLSVFEEKMLKHSDEKYFNNIHSAIRYVHDELEYLKNNLR